MTPTRIRGVDHDAFHLSTISLHELADEINLHEFGVHVPRKYSERFGGLVQCSQDIDRRSFLEFGKIVKARRDDVDVWLIERRDASGHRL